MLSPDADAKMPDELVGKWSCFIQSNDGTAIGSHIQFYGADGHSWREGLVELEIDADTFANFNYRLEAFVVTNGKQMLEFDYELSSAEVLVNGEPSDEMTKNLSASISNDLDTRSDVVHLSEHSLAIVGSDEITSCIKLD